MAESFEIRFRRLSLKENDQSAIISMHLMLVPRRVTELGPYVAKLTNPYHRDAAYFLKQAIDGVVEEKEGEVNLSHALHLALGVERLLKGVLWDEHPAFTLMDETFDNTAKVFYGTRLKEIGAEAGSNTKKEGNADSVTYRIAATRARVFSDATRNHFGVLMKLGHFRDIVAHNDLSKLDLRDVAFFLRRNLHSILNAFEKEGVGNASALMGKNEPMLRQWSIDYIEDLQARVSKRLEFHLQQFRERPHADKVPPRPILPPKFEEWDTKIECPACGQDAKVRQEVDFDVVDGQAVPQGVFISHLFCAHCGLYVDDYEELEEMKITSETINRYD